MEKNECFDYSYSAAQRKEIEEIRKKYMPQEEGKVERLRRLHHSASQRARIWAISLGVIGALVMGTGMSLAMTDLGDILGGGAMVLGIGVGVLGMILVALAYPVYERVLEKQRQKIAPEVLRLAEEILDDR